VLSNPAGYDRKEITVRGIYQFEIHGSEFWGRDCVSRDKMVNMRAVNVKAHKQFVKGMRKLQAHQPADMVIRGRFWIAQEGRCFGGPACDLYEIEETELLWVQPIQDDPKSGEKSGPMRTEPDR
jgi:hypothetical protein